MTLPLIKAVLATGDQYGSGLRDMMAWLKICHLGNVSDAQAQMYLDYLNGDDNDVFRNNEKD
jgi:hypothetical protein